MQAFTASGTITYFWAGEKVQAPATIRAQGSDQFRLDANLPRGTRSVVLDHDTGASKDETGKLTQIPLHNRLSRGGSSFPYLSIAAALSDPTMIVTYVGLVQAGNQQLYQVRTARKITAEQDPRGLSAKLSQTDYFIDSKTNLKDQSRC